jgi:hypothetical protein
MSTREEQLAEELEHCVALLRMFHGHYIVGASTPMDFTDELSRAYSLLGIDVSSILDL